MWWSVINVCGITECKNNDSNNRKNSCIVTVHREYKGATEICSLKNRGSGVTWEISVGSKYYEDKKEIAVK